MKKITAVVMAFIIAASLSFTAFASDNTEEKGSLSDYRFKVFSRDEVIAIADEIASATYYEPFMPAADTESVIISIDLRSHPELGNISVFIKTVHTIVERSAGFVTGTAEKVELMNYNQVAGELALHIAALMMLDQFADTGLIENIEELYIMLEIADLNIDEQRVSPMLINIVGSLIMDVLDIIF